jgi:hypothetical protein
MRLTNASNTKIGWQRKPQRANFVYELQRHKEYAEWSVLASQKTGRIASSRLGTPSLRQSSAPPNVKAEILLSTGLIFRVKMQLPNK